MPSARSCRTFSHRLACKADGTRRVPATIRIVIIRLSPLTTIFMKIVAAWQPQRVITKYRKDENAKEGILGGVASRLAFVISHFRAFAIRLEYSVFGTPYSVLYTPYSSLNSRLSSRRSFPVAPQPPTYAPPRGFCVTGADRLARRKLLIVINLRYVVRTASPC